ncbi:MAG: S8 family serine peptidase [Ignavibacteria bacterium]|nr:S8 family serine peptidase [Ignavibacteria bacterium]
MVRRSLVLIGVLMLSLGLGICFGQSLQSQLTQKLHPAFQALVANELPTAAIKVMADGRGPSGMTKEGEPLYDAIITTTNAAAVRAAGVHLNSVFGKIATARLTKQHLLTLAQSDAVQYLDPGSINYPQIDLSVPEIGATLLHAGFLNKTPYKGKGVIVVIYDTGIDWRHHDFRDPSDTTKTRILSIWDQTLTASSGSGEAPPAGFTYGVEYTKQQIENEIDGSPANFVREKDINGHGTHVASTAAGNGSSHFNKYIGVAPEADIVVVKGGDESFSESGMINGLTYAANKAAALSKPVVVNWSIGGQTGPHDGTRGYEVAVDNFVQTPGRVVAISAGNDGAQIMHSEGTISSGDAATISVNVPTFTPTAGADNDKFTLEVWFNSSIGLTATATSPSGISVSASTDASSSAANNNDGSIDLFNSKGSNGNRFIQLAVRDRDTTKVTKSGVWTLALSSVTNAAAYDAWLSSSTVGSSTVTIVGGNAQKTVSSPGTSFGAITVGSYLSRNGWPSINGISYVVANPNPPHGSLSSFSSLGPTGDGRTKPDIAAPGQRIAAALSAGATPATSSILPDGKHQAIQGTSMASPHVAGAAALLLGILNSRTAAEIKLLLTTTATTDTYTQTVPNTSWGYGKLDVLKSAAKALNPQAAVQRQMYSADAEGTSSVFAQALTGSTRLAYRFAPTFGGTVTGMYVSVSNAARSIVGTGSLVCEIWSSSPGAGVPGNKLGTAVLKPLGGLTMSTNNFIDMLPAGVDVGVGQFYHVVIAMSNAQDTVRIRTDQSGTLSNMYSISTGGTGWSPVTTGGNLRIRASVASVSGLVWAGVHEITPRVFTLSQNYPNPFNPTTTIRYSVPAQGRVRLRVFDLVGREVASLVDEEEASGSYLINWRGTDNYGRPLASGVYFYKLDGPGQQITKKLILLK